MGNPRRTNATFYELAMINPRGQPYPLVRMRNPNDSTLYYRHGNGEPWVKVGYTKWSRAEWFEKFGGVEPDNRIWEFFGEPIELWPPGSEEEDKRGE